MIPKASHPDSPRRVPNGARSPWAASEPSVFTPKPAIRGHFKTGHQKTSRTTVVMTRAAPAEQDFPPLSERSPGRDSVRLGRLDLTEAMARAGSANYSIWLNSHDRAKSQSRLTVASEMPKALPTSSSVSPPKNLSSTTCAARESSPSSRPSA